MRWNANRFGSDQTYEHEFYIDAYDNSTYLSTAQTPYDDCMPITTSSQSTWGSAAYTYLDTRLEEPGDGWCEAGRIGYVIGAGNAIAISSGVTHYNYIRTYNGNANSDRFQLSAQLGVQRPPGCITTWCSFGTNKVPLVGRKETGEWSVNVPGVKDWVKP